MRRVLFRGAFVVYFITLSQWSFGSVNPGIDVSLKMFKSIAKTAEQTNFVFSPYAIRAGLGMAALGAKGRTQKQLGKAPELGQTKKEPAYKLMLANRLWVQYGFPLHENYKETCEKVLGDVPWMVDFTKAPDFLKDRVNGWVEEKTMGKLRRFVTEDSVDPTAKMLLTTGVYFKGLWMSPFQRSATEEDEFQLVDGGTLKGDFVHKVGSYNYFKNDDVQLLDIPYSDGEVSILLILPRARAKQGLGQIEQSLRPESIEQWVNSFQLKEIDVKLPKFEFEASYEISDALKAIGVVDAFSPEEADFSGMTQIKGLYLSRTIHKTFFGLTEEGTEAASISIESTSRGPASKVSPEPFYADRPFIFLVRHRPSNSILFMGHVQKPNSRSAS